MGKKFDEEQKIKEEALIKNFYDEKVEDNKNIELSKSDNELNKDEISYENSDNELIKDEMNDKSSDNNENSKNRNMRCRQCGRSRT